MDDRPIGIFDSGVGGLTGLKALLRLLPGEDYVFFADTGRMPYGPRPQEELRAIALQDMDCLASFGVKAILSACGTISSAAHRELETYPVPAFGVLHPAVAAMAAVGGDAPLGVIATSASIESGQFTLPLRALCPGREIVWPARNLPRWSRPGTSSRTIRCCARPSRARSPRCGEKGSGPCCSAARTTA